MAESTFNGQELKERLTKIIEANLKNEQFGVPQLVREMQMSHSSLHRAVKNATGLSISQFICQVRLKNAHELLKQKKASISEIAYDCGFHSVTYFNKCFHDYYGYSPGEVKNHPETEKSNTSKTNLPPSKQKKWLITSVFLTAILIILFFTHEMFDFPVLTENKSLGKTIAVLPFKNDSPDSANTYFINGLMESILNNLSNIEDLSVRSRTSVEKYRAGNKSLKEIAKELNVDYLVEGNGQKYGDEVLLNIQLIEAQSDRHLFSEQYRREIKEVKDFIDLQSEIALNIVSKINAVITPEEEQNIKEIPTESMAAYNFYLQGYEYLMLAQKQPLWQFTEECIKANELLTEAVRLDPTFSDAYRHLAHNYINNLSFFSHDNYQARKFLDTGLVLVNKALEYDKTNWGALAVKRQYYLKKGIYREASEIQKELPEKWGDNHDRHEIEFSTSYWTDDYHNAIKSFYHYVQIKPDEIPPYMIFMIASCLAEMGYPETGKKYAGEFIEQYNDSLSFYSTMALIELFSGNFQSSAKYGILANDIDSTDISAILYLLIDYTYQRNHPEIKKYLAKLENIKNSHYLWVNQDLFAGFACLETGLKNKADEYFKRAIETQQTAIEFNTPASQRFEAHIYLTAIYAALGEHDKALEYLKMVTNRKIIPKIFLIQLQYWPGTEIFRENPEFQKIFIELEARYQKEHLRIGKLLRELGEEI